MKKRITVISLFVALAALFLATLPAVSPAAVTLNPYEQQLVKAINKKRVKFGLAKVSVHAKLVNAAQGHSADMEEQQYFEHNSLSTGETWSARLIRYGYVRSGFSFWKTGENIYKVSGLYAAFPETAVKGAVKAWMNSPAHRKVILTRCFRNIGVGVATSGDTKYFTLDLGRRIK